MQKQFNNKQRFFFDLHSVFMLRLMSGEFEMILKLIEAAMEYHGVKFKDIQEVDPEFTIIDASDMLYSFGELVNAMKYTDVVNFIYLCEGFMDISPLVKKDNEVLYAKPFKVAAIAERVGNVTIVEPVKTEAA